MVTRPDRHEAEQLFASGQTISHIARHLRLPRSTVDGWHKSWKYQAPPAPAPELQAMQEAAQRQQHRLPVEGYDDDPFPVADTWRRLEIENAKRIEKAHAQSRFKVTLPNVPTVLTFISDQHISGGNLVDLKRMREDAEFIAQSKNVYAILGGDGIDGHIKHRGAMIAARSTPDDQLKLYDYYLQILAEKIIVAISGNHDHWMHQFTSVDMIRWLAEKNRLRYSPPHAFVEVTVGQVPYRVCIAHQWRMNSQMNLTHTVKQMLNFGEHDFDIGCVCHHHEASVETCRRRSLQRVFLRPGAYQIQSDYGAQLGYPSTVPTCPSVAVFPQERKLVAFDSVYDAVYYLKGIQ